MGDLCEGSRISIASTIVQLAENAAAMAEESAARTSNVLHPVMSPSFPPEPNEKTTVVEEEYPPLFGDLRRNLIMIISALESINNSLNRTEL